MHSRMSDGLSDVVSVTLAVWDAENELGILMHMGSHMSIGIPRLCLLVTSAT